MPKKSPSEAEAKLARVLEYQRALAAFSRVSGESMDPNRLMQHATAQVSALTHVGRVKVLRYRPDQGDLLVEAGVGWKLGVIGRATLGIDHASPPGRAIQTGMAVAILVGATRAFGDYSEWHTYQEVGPRSIVALTTVVLTF
jgi:hypothetical protein